MTGDLREGAGSMPISLVNVVIREAVHSNLIRVTGEQRDSRRSRHGCTAGGMDNHILIEKEVNGRCVEKDRWRK